MFSLWNIIQILVFLLVYFERPPLVDHFFSFFGDLLNPPRLRSSTIFSLLASALLTPTSTARSSPIWMSEIEKGKPPSRCGVTIFNNKTKQKHLSRRKSILPFNGCSTLKLWKITPEEINVNKTFYVLIFKIKLSLILWAVVWRARKASFLQDKLMVCKKCFFPTVLWIVGGNNNNSY